MVPSASFGSKNVFFSNIEGRMLSDGTSFELVVCLLFKKDTIVSILFIFEKKWQQRGSSIRPKLGTPNHASRMSELQVVESSAVINFGSYTRSLGPTNDRKEELNSIQSLNFTEISSGQRCIWRNHFA